MRQTGCLSMLFNSFIFLGVFLPITYAVFWLLGTAKARYVWLTVTGYIFYGYWDPRFCLLMAASTLVSYTAGLGFLRWSDPRHRKLCLVIPITVDLSLLGFFKYGGFVIDSVGRVIQALGAGVRIPAWDVVLPVGISFYTFHTITYIVDSYRGVIRPTRNLFEFPAYVSLFSQLVAGPIVRFRQIEEDLENMGHADRRRWLGLACPLRHRPVQEGGGRGTAAPLRDPPAALPATSSRGRLAGMLGYTFQLYFDFSGYSDMAIGLGCMFGLRLPLNFNSPYRPSDAPTSGAAGTSPSPVSCATISTSRWAATGSGATGKLPQSHDHHAARRAVARRQLDLRRVGRVPRSTPLGVPPLERTWDRLPAFARQLAMFGAAVVGWVFFRSTDFEMAGVLLSKMFVYSRGDPAAAGLPMILFLVFSGWWAMAGPNAIDLHRRWPPRPRRALALAAAFGACLAIMLGNGSSPFLYFQF